VEKIWELTRGEAIICTEVGQNRCGRRNSTSSRTALLHLLRGSAPWASDFGAIGAQVAFPDRLVVDIAETAASR